MIDREKVIKELEERIKVAEECMGNPMFTPDAIRTIVALLKEQEEEIENLKQVAQSMMEGIVISTSMFYPCESCQEFNCDFCKFKRTHS